MADLSFAAVSPDTRRTRSALTIAALSGRSPRRTAGHVKRRQKRYILPFLELATMASGLLPSDRRAPAVSTGAC